jgi:hypothetical protein
MPKKMEQSLMRRAAEMGLKGERKDAYVYGTMAKMAKEKEKKPKPKGG